MRSLNVESLARDCKEPVEMRWAESRLECEECGVQQVVRHTVRLCARRSARNPGYPLR